MQTRRQRSGIKRRLADLVREVREWAAADGWQNSKSRGNSLYKVAGDGTRRRLEFGERGLREQVWQERGYQYAGSSTTGAWTNVHSCPWSLVRIEGGRLVRDKNSCRPLPESCRPPESMRKEAVNG